MGIKAGTGTKNVIVKGTVTEIVIGIVCANMIARNIGQGIEVIGSVHATRLTTLVVGTIVSPVLVIGIEKEVKHRPAVDLVAKRIKTSQKTSSKTKKRGRRTRTTTTRKKTRRGRRKRIRKRIKRIKRRANMKRRNRLMEPRMMTLNLTMIRLIKQIRFLQIIQVNISTVSTTIRFEGSLLSDSEGS